MLGWIQKLIPWDRAPFSITGIGENYAVVVWKRPMFVGSSSDNEMIQKVTELLERGGRSFLFDMRTVGFIGTSGLGALLCLSRNVKERRGRAVFVFNSARVMQVIKVVGFDKLLTVVMDYSEAIRILEEGDSFSITGIGENYAVVVWKRSMFVGSSSANEMIQKVTELLERGERSFLFDLRTIGYVGSTGLGALYYLTRSVEEHGGRAVFVFDSTRVMHVIKVTGIDVFLTVVMNYSEAIRILEEGDGGSGIA
jgi:anti-anti-sigma factor